MPFFQHDPLHRCVIVPRSAIVTGMGMELVIVHGDKLGEAWKPAIGHLRQAAKSQALRNCI